MGFKIKNSLTGEFEKLPILTLKGEKGEPGEGVEEYDKVDYMGNKYETLKQANDANVEYAVKTAIGEFNYLDYEGKHITATNSIAGQAKSAILKGQTMVNLLDAEILKGNKGKINVLFNVSLEDDYFVSNHGNGQFQLVNDDGKSPFEGVFEEGKTYTLIMDVITTDKTSDGDEIYLELNTTTHTTPGLTFKNANGIIKRAFKATKRATPETKSVFRIGFYDSAITKINRKIMLLEGDYTNVNIPYFEGMASCKMPVLTTTGKNLFDMNNASYTTGLIHVSNQTINQTSITKAYYIPCEPNTSYTISKMTTLYFRICETSVVPTYGCAISNTVNNPSKASLTITTSESAKYLCFNVHNVKEDTVDESEVLATLQIEKGTVATAYEPYKSNILTVNEEVTLRGIGDVKDTLDLMTGEVVERISEMVLNGSENWSIPTNFSNGDCKGYSLSVNGLTSNIVCDGLKTLPNSLKYAGEEGVFVSDNLLIVKKKIATRELFKQWLSQNPLTVQYQLATESNKTVDLSDNHVYSYKGTTHYDCSGAEDSLVPTLSVKVPTDVQAIIAQQRETIQTLNSENERLNQIQEALKSSMLDSQVQLMNLSWNTDFEVFTLRESIAPKDLLLDSKIGSNIDKFSQAKFIIENDCPDLEKLNSQIEYYFSKDVFSQEQFEELTDLISIVKGGKWL